MPAPNGQHTTALLFGVCKALDLLPGDLLDQPYSLLMEYLAYSKGVSRVRNAKP